MESIIDEKYTIIIGFIIGWIVTIILLVNIKKTIKESRESKKQQDIQIQWNKLKENKRPE